MMIMMTPPPNISIDGIGGIDCFSQAGVFFYIDAQPAHDNTICFFFWF